VLEKKIQALFETIAETLKEIRVGMAHIQFDSRLLDALKDKVVVLTGGATGIGRSAVKLFHGNLSNSN
jgi:2-phosphoglycerate kinase